MASGKSTEISMLSLHSNEWQIAIRYLQCMNKNDGHLHDQGKGIYLRTIDGRHLFCGGTPTIPRRFFDIFRHEGLIAQVDELGTNFVLTEKGVEFTLLDAGRSEARVPAGV